MKVGDIIQDYQFPTDRGIILLKGDKGDFYYVLAFGQAFASWLREDYIKKCKVVR